MTGRGYRDGSRDRPLSGLLEAFTGGRPLPSNEEAEQALLGAVLSNRHALEKVRDILKADDFYVSSHGRIYAACLLLLDQGRVPTPISLRRVFVDDSDLDDVGGAGYLTDLAESIVSVLAAEEHARTIVDCARKRAIIEAAVEVAQAAIAPESLVPVDDLLDQAEERFATIAPASMRKGLRPFASVVDDMHEYWRAVDSGALKPIETGLVDFDRQVGGLMPGDVMVVGGRPGAGKSGMVRTVVANIARGGKPCALFSQEMTDMQVAMGIVQQHGPAVDPAGMRRGDIPRDVMTRLVQYSTEIRSLPLWIDDSSGLTIESFRSRLRALKREQPELTLVGIDYLQLMSPPQTREMSGTQGVEYLSKNIKITAKEEGVAIVLLSQLNRAVESRDGKRPTMADLRSSGSIEQDADSVVLIFREEYYLQQEMPTSRSSHDDGSFQRWESKMEEVRGVAELIVAKNRFGTPGVVRIHFDGARGLFTNAAPGYLNGRGATKPNGAWHDEDWRE